MPEILSACPNHKQAHFRKLTKQQRGHGGMASSTIFNSSSTIRKRQFAAGSVSGVQLDFLELLGLTASRANSGSTTPL